MKQIRRASTLPIRAIIALVAVLMAVFLLFGLTRANAQQPGSGERLLTIYDRGEERVILTDQPTIGAALENVGIEVGANDTIEPSLDEPLLAGSYSVNIYRARPVVVVDGTTRSKVMTPYQTAPEIAQDTGLQLYDEDITKVDRTDDLVGDGAALRLTIDRATPFTFVLYGKKTDARTQATTVGEMLSQKGIVLGANDTLSVPKETAITANATVELWRNGKQTITEDSAIDFPVEKINDVDKPVGYREIKTPGTKGKRTVTYEVVMKNGVEESRTEIQSITTEEPKKQTEIVGIKAVAGAGLTKSKGVFQFTDSRGITHRETYYDLPMNVVMRNCGAGGQYTVRADGVKVDASGYVIIAANLARYPRCSVVETSLGPAKVYDTGGFAAVHPEGYDLATDWTNNNGI